MTSSIDQWLSIAERALRSMSAVTPATRAYPVQGSPSQVAELTPSQRAESAALMRVNHVGEVCAQALYEAQAVATDSAPLRAAFLAAAAEERDHLAWTERRIAELDGRTSVLNPLWYAGSFAIGLVAARLGDKLSLGFMAETERQVEQHLQSHLERLPSTDIASRQVVSQMRADEAAHRTAATELGGVTLPLPARLLMRLAAKVMTTTSHHL